MTAVPQGRDSAACDRRNHVQRPCFLRCRSPIEHHLAAGVNAAGRLAVYGAVLVGVFLASSAAGAALDPVGLSNAEPETHSGAMDGGDGLPGLATTADDLTLEVDSDTVAVGQPTTYSFRITTDDGVVTEFDLEQTKRMHLIVVRRDFVAFQHLHPDMASDGTWSTAIRLDAPGVYRVYADFIADGDKHTLGADLFAAGAFEPVPMPPASRSGDAGDGYTIELVGDVVAGEPSELEFVVRHDGHVVDDLDDYLGAKGHLVALRDGDLAYLHVHPEEDRLLFETEFPTASTYRLYLQFAHGGTVHTGELTVHAEEAK